MKIDITKKYRTRDAKWPVTIVSTGGPYSGFPVVGYTHATSIPLLCHWSEVGGYPANTNLDLIEVREPREWTAVVALEGSLMPTGTLTHYDPEDDCAPHYEVIRVREIID